MQIERSTFSALTERAAQACRGEGGTAEVRELELRCTFPIRRTAFTDALTYYKHVAKVDVRESREKVVASVEGYRVTLPSAAAAKTEAHLLPMMQKLRVAPPVDLPEYGLRLNLKSETEVPATSLATRDVVARAVSKPREPLLIRDKHRFSCAVAPDVRVDMTVVRQWTTTTPLEEEEEDDAAAAATETLYEAEVEYVPQQQPQQQPQAQQPPKRTTTTTKRKKNAMNATNATTTGGGGGGGAEEVVRSLLRAASVLLKILKNVQYLLPQSTAHRVVQEYAELVGPSRHRGGDRNGAPPFVGPKPVTLMQEHLCAIVRNGDYTLTEKADGERRFLFVDREGRLFTMNDRLDVSFTGLTSRDAKADAGTLLDGEFLPPTAERPYPMFLAFDTYFWAGKDVREMPLMSSSYEHPSRLALGQKFLSGEARFVARSAERDCRCVMKTFYPLHASEESLHEAVRNVVRRREAQLFPYEVDGLIFTPAHLAVGQEEEKQTTRHKHKETRCLSRGGPFGGGTWRKAFKWKPPEMNTVDFMVRFRRDTDADVDVESSTLRQLTAELLVGRDVSADPDPVGSLDFFSSSSDGNKNNNNKRPRDYRAVPFVSRENSGYAHETTLDVPPRTTQHNEEIPDGGVVEFAYRKDGDDEGGGGRWVPLRNRHDKKMPNSQENAEAVWRSIRFPIEERVLVGADPEARTLFERMCHGDGSVVVDASRYYVRNTKEVDRRDLGLYPMNQFHNWVKARILGWFSGVSDVRALLDLGSGKGGDIGKWLAMRGLERVLGLDLYLDSIVDPVDGAYVRLRSQLQSKGSGGSSPDVAFVAYDLREPLNESGLRAMDRDAHGNREFAHILWGLRDAASIRDPGLRRMHGFASRRPFDLVSCQFAVHYFFSSASVLRVFAQNVADSLRPGGYFLGTCLDGTAVDAALRSKARGDGISSGGGSTSPPLWHVQKLYDGSMSDVTDPSQRLGFAVRVYLESIGQAQVEYLVDFQTMRAEMARVGLVPVSPPVPEGKAFEDETTKASGTGSFAAAFRAMKDGGGREAREASRVSAALGMTDVHKTYSFLNRWFLFRKR